MICSANKWAGFSMLGTSVMKKIEQWNQDDWCLQRVFSTHFKLIFLLTDVQWCSAKKAFFEILQNVQENTCARVSFLIDRLSKQTPAQMFSCEFRKIFKNNYFYRTTLVATSVLIPPPENNRKPDVVLMLSVVGGGGRLGDEIRSMIWNGLTIPCSFIWWNLTINT